MGLTWEQVTLSDRQIAVITALAEFARHRVDEVNAKLAPVGQGTAARPGTIAVNGSIVPAVRADEIDDIIGQLYGP
jgi:hypothetical protein